MFEVGNMTNENEKNQELPEPRKVNSWQDLTQETFLEALEDPQFHQFLINKYTNADLKIFSKVHGYYPDQKPSVIVAWNPSTGNLEIHHYTRSKDNSRRILRGVTTIVPGINLNKIKLYKDNTGSVYISDLELKRMFLAEDYLQFKKITGSNATLVLEMLNMLPVSEEPKQLRIYEKDGKFYLPDKSEIFVRDSIIQNLVNSFNIIGSREEYQKALNDLWHLLSPKQKADFVAQVGIPIINILIDLRKLGYTKSYMLSFGSTKAGKTWIYKIGMKLLWGFDLLEGNAFWQGDSIGSQYRLHAILSSTNLPIYIDEVESRSKEIVDILKSAAVGSTSFRGTASQSQITYHDSATLLATAQHNVYLSSNLALADELAILRRFYYNSYESGDADKDRVHEHVLFEAELKVRGLVFDILKHYTVDQLIGIVNEIMQQVGDDTTTAGLILGAALLGLDVEEFRSLKWSGNRDLSPREETYELIRRDAIRVAQAVDKDYVARDLSSLIGVKEKDGKKYILITSAYINYVNAQSSHPLKDKFHSLSDLKELELLFVEEELKALPVRIYEREYREWFNGRTMSVAVLPYRYIEESDKNKLENFDNITQPYTNLTQNLTHIFISINNKILHTYTINSASYNNSTESHISINQNLCKEPQNPQNSNALSRQNSENMENEVRNAGVRPCKECNEPQASNAATPQTPTKPADTPTTTAPASTPANPATPDTTHTATKSSTNPHSDTQAQASPQVLSPQPETPVPDTYNTEQATQTQQQATVLLSKTTQQTRAAEQEAPVTPQQQDARLKEAVQRVYNAVCVAQRKDEPFWQREDLGQPNENLFPALETLTTDLIEKALQTLERQGYIYQQKPNHWRTVRHLYVADIVYYNDPEHLVYCPNCGKPVSKLYWYGADWLCIDCLNELQHKNDYNEVY